MSPSNVESLNYVLPEMIVTLSVLVLVILDLLVDGEKKRLEKSAVPHAYSAARRRNCPHAASMSLPRERRKCATSFRARNTSANASAVSLDDGLGSP